MNKQIITDKFIEAFLGDDLDNNVDWVRVGSYFRRFVTPPKIVEDEYEIFSDGLKIIIPLKLKEALEIKESLKLLRKKRINLILDEVSTMHQWFYLLLEAHLFSEYYAISKWINYWLDLWHEVNNEPKPGYRANSKVSEDEIGRAKEYPISNLYKRKLRRSGERLCGLCPFHKEKTPSFFIFPDNHWYCFGACSCGGDSINYLMKLENLCFVDAVKRLNHE